MSILATLKELFQTSPSVVSISSDSSVLVGGDYAVRVLR
mgnify:CR=1 FL=1